MEKVDTYTLCNILLMVPEYTTQRETLEQLSKMRVNKRFNEIIENNSYFWKGVCGNLGIKYNGQNYHKMTSRLTYTKKERPKETPKLIKFMCLVGFINACFFFYQLKR